MGNRWSLESADNLTDLAQRHAQLPTGMKSVQAGRLPPLRIDRDAILVGTVKSRGAVSEGTLELSRRDDRVRRLSIVGRRGYRDRAIPILHFLPGLVKQSPKKTVD